MTEIMNKITVEELIKHLKKFDQDALTNIYVKNGNLYFRHFFILYRDKLGRPAGAKGRQQKPIRLDKYKDEIKKYLEKKIPVSSICKLLGEPRTLIDYYIKTRLSHTKD